MTYFAPYVDETGLHLPTFQDVVDFYTNGAKDIFGEDIYVDADSMDGELISILSKAVYDALKSIEYAYNNYSPQTAVGEALSRVVKLSGVWRVKSGYSTVFLTLTGSPYTIIKNGVVADVSGNKWDLPEIVNLGSTGVYSTTATAQTKGAITALPNTVNQIVTPTAGWTSVTNPNAAVPAQPLENDYVLRDRQAKAVELPSQGLVEGTESAIKQISNITDAIVKENDTKAPITIDGVELPPNSILCIVEGGSETEIAQTIFYRKNQGCYSAGSLELPVYDRFNNITYCRFDRPDYLEPYFYINITPLVDYSTEFINSIKTLVVNYINNLGLSNDIIHSALYTIVNDSINDIDKPNFRINTITMGMSSTELTTNDIIVNLNQKCKITTDNVTVEVTNA